MEFCLFQGSNEKKNGKKRTFLRLKFTKSHFFAGGGLFCQKKSFLQGIGDILRTIKKPPG